MEPKDHDEKSHTFRKRRLTYSKLNLDPVAVAALENLAESEAEAEAEAEAKVGGSEREGAKTNNTDGERVENGDETQNAGAKTEAKEPKTDNKDDSMDNFSKTFRKRRLTLTKHQVASALAAVVAEIADDLSDEEDDHDTDPLGAKRRRFSDTSRSTCDGRLKSKIVHAGEIARNTNPVGQSNSQLYQGPFKKEQDLTEEEKSMQPSWKRRMTRRNSENEVLLPFPRTVVGTYSCHGVEPVYESDYEPNPLEENDSDEEAWLQNINGVVDAVKDEEEEGEEEEEEEEGENANKNDRDMGIDSQPAKKLTTVAKINQDRGGIAFPYGNCRKTALFAVYDGHGQGGELVSQYALYHIQKRLEKHPDFNNNIDRAFKETFVAVDKDLTEEPMIEPLYSGTTACVALLRENHLTVSNTGDSRAVLARSNSDGGWESIDLSQDQNPDLPEEQSRIEQEGGFVSPPPGKGLSARVWLDAGFTQIGLAMSRSIGDHVMKDVGVIAEPEVTHHEVQDNDEFMILASDGVWEFITSEEAVMIVGKNICKGASRACQSLIEAAANRWHQEEGDYRDDITALVIRLGHVWDSVEQAK